MIVVCGYSFSFFPHDKSTFRVIDKWLTPTGTGGNWQIRQGWQAVKEKGREPTGGTPLNETQQLFYSNKYKQHSRRLECVLLWLVLIARSYWTVWKSWGMRERGWSTWKRSGGSLKKSNKLKFKTHVVNLTTKRLKFSCYISVPWENYWRVNFESGTI